MPSSRTVVVQLSRSRSAGRNRRIRYPVITRLGGYWRQVGRHGVERLLWSIRITSSLVYPNHRSRGRPAVTMGRPGSYIFLAFRLEWPRSQSAIVSRLSPPRATLVTNSTDSFAGVRLKR